MKSASSRLVVENSRTVV